MKKIISMLLAITMIASAFTACGGEQSSGGTEVTYTGIQLSDDGVLVGGEAASTDSSSAVYVSNDIIFYLEGQGAEYGEGEADEGHSQAEADKHTVINITKPGNYTVSGSISHGQIAVNLGTDAKKDPDAVVNITLNNADITCTVAPAIVCFKAYECGDDNLETATKDVDTSKAGFNLTIADDSVNNINGSHVAKIYKPGTTDKLHKYDAAIESMVTFNIYGEDGVLNVNADNEGIETKMHLTIHGSEINIHSADDALNAGEDGVSVITINDGKLLADSNGGAEGDGIDSNGWLFINGGYVSAFGKSTSMDSGLDSDNGIYINGGIVFATGNMYDEIVEDSQQNFVVFNFASPIATGEFAVLKSIDDKPVAALESVAGGTNWIYSSPLLTAGYYTMHKVQSVTGDAVNGVYGGITSTEGEVQLGYLSTGAMGGFGGMMGGQRPQGGFNKGEMPEDFDPSQVPQWNMDGFDMENMPEDFDFSQIPQGGKGNRPQGNMPENFGSMGKPEGNMPENFGGMTRPEGFGGNGGQPMDAPEGMPENFNFGSMPQQNGVNIPVEQQKIFTIEKGANFFSGITEFAEA